MNVISCILRFYIQPLAMIYNPLNSCQAIHRSLRFTTWLLGRVSSCHSSWVGIDDMGCDVTHNSQACLWSDSDFGNPGKCWHDPSEAFLTQHNSLWVGWPSLVPYRGGAPHLWDVKYGHWWNIHGATVSPDWSGSTEQESRKTKYLRHVSQKTTAEIEMEMQTEVQDSHKSVTGWFLVWLRSAVW